MIDKLQTWLLGGRPNLYAVLDIGTTEAKALIVLVDKGKAIVVGAGRQPHQDGAIADASLADVTLAALACEQALAQAENLTEEVVGEKLVADHAVVGLSGPMLKSTCVSLALRRARPQQRISNRELQGIVQRAQRLALQQAREVMAEDRASAGIQVGLVDAVITRIMVDGYAVHSAIGAQGAQVEVCLSNVFAPTAYLVMASSVAARLDLETMAILSGVSSVAHMPSVVSRGDAIVVDIGGECTDVALVRRGGIESLQSLPLGGMSFTRRVSRTLGVPLAAAEETKRKYAEGRLDQSRTMELRLAFASDIQALVDGLRGMLKGMAGHNELPAHIFLSGGGSVLPDIQQAIRSHPWIHVLPFARHPQMTILQPRSIPNLNDGTRRLGDVFGVPACLAACAVSQADDAPQRILKQVLHGMGLS